jgi:hypothetical protein
MVVMVLLIIWVIFTLITISEDKNNDHLLFDYKNWGKKAIVNRILALPFLIITVPILLIIMPFLFTYFWIQEKLE